MSYRLFNDIDFVRIQSEAGDKFVRKAAIQEVLVIGTLFVKLDLGYPLRDIYINYTEVLSPGFTSNIDMRDTLLNWLNYYTPLPQQDNHMNTNTNRRRQPVSRQRKAHLQQTEPVPEELRFIKRFVHLNGKTKSKEILLRFINTLQKAIIEKRIRKTSRYAEWIELVQKRLVNFYNKMPSSQEIFRVSENDLKSLSPLISKQRVRVLSDVRLIKQFINLTGRSGVKQKAQLLLSRIGKIYPGLRIPHDDPYASKLIAIIRSLKQFTGKDGGTILEISKAELNGLEAIAYDHEDTYAEGYDDEDEDDYYHVAGYDERVTSSMELGEADRETLGLQGKWLELMGDPVAPFTVLIHGGQESGKTHLCLELAAYLARNHGTVLYIHTGKEGSDPAFNQKIQHVEIRHPKLYVAAGILHDLSTYDFVFIDNINDLQLSAADLEALEETHSQQSFIYVFEDGELPGRKNLVHPNTDIRIEVPEKGKAIQHY
jgi:hypothetical protein